MGEFFLPHQITVLPKTPLFHQRLTRSRVSPDDDDAATDLDSSPAPAPLTPKAAPSPPPADGPARRVGNCRTRHRPPRRPRAGPGRTPAAGAFRPAPRPDPRLGRSFDR